MLVLGMGWAGGPPLFFSVIRENYTNTLDSRTSASHFPSLMHITSVANGNSPQTIVYCDGLRYIPRHPVRCRSSVVEHSLGKGEVDSSILSGSTSTLSLRGIPRKLNARVLCKRLEFLTIEIKMKKAVKTSLDVRANRRKSKLKAKRRRQRARTPTPRG